MNKHTVIKNLKHLLTCDDDVFEKDVRSVSRMITADRFRGNVHVCGLLAVSNHCKNSCTYCGLRAPGKDFTRFRLSPDEVKRAVDMVVESGLSRIFFVSGEDIHLSIDDITAMVAYAKSRNLHVSLGMGLFPPETMMRFREAGADCYALKFESADPVLFTRCKPDAGYHERMEGIKKIKKLGFELGSGNIIGLKDQTIDNIVKDILLMHELGIDWAPIVPYIPSPGTPMAESTGMGNVNLLLKEISLLRILLPDVIITAGQPTQDSRLGFADPEGTLNALDAGGNILFADVTPAEVRENFKITPGRILPSVHRIDAILSGAGLRRI